MTKIDLTHYTRREHLPEGYQHARPFLVRILWHFVSALVFQNQFVPVYGPKVRLLRWFGATVGEGVLIKPGVTIKYPWYLELGDHVWIGEDAWLDNTTHLRIGNHVVISQGVFLCCGSHDWSDPGMDSFTHPIVVEDGVWICAFARLALGITVGEDAVILMGAIVLRDCEPSGIYQGHPAERVGTRKVRSYPGPKRDEAPVAS